LVRVTDRLGRCKMREVRLDSTDSITSSRYSLFCRRYLFTYIRFLQEISCSFRLILLINAIGYGIKTRSSTIATLIQVNGPYSGISTPCICCAYMESDYALHLSIVITEGTIQE